MAVHVPIDELSGLPEDEMARLLSRGVPADGAGRLEESVRSILASVRARGDAALRDLTLAYDGAALADLRVSGSEWGRAVEAVPRGLATALARAAKRVETFARANLPQATKVQVAEGVTLAREPVPLARVGCYVPGGKASYPSTVLMTVIPARVAGVREIYVATPPARDGSVDAGVLAAARIAGATGVFKMGGAQAVAAFAYGTESVPRVDKVVGPGNAWVTEAKRQLAGTVGIDGLAGPSEVVVWADPDADPALVAWDLAAQAEHAEDSRCLLVTTSRALAQAVAGRLEDTLALLPRRSIAQAALERHGRLLVAASDEAAAAFIDRYAPEHLEVLSAKAASKAALVSNAGTVFLGPYAPTAAGDYATGANHVLPTGGTARHSSGLGPEAFVRLVTRQTVTAAGLAGMHSVVKAVGQWEGLDGHVFSVEARRLAGIPRPGDTARPGARKAKRGPRRTSRRPGAAAERSGEAKRAGGRAAATKRPLTPKERAQREYAARMKGVRARAARAKGGAGPVKRRSAARRLRRELGLGEGS